MKRLKAKILLLALVAIGYLAITSINWNKREEQTVGLEIISSAHRVESVSTKWVKFLRHVQQPRAFDELQHHSYVDSCEEGMPWNQWIVLDRAFYFRRSSAYYIKEAHFFRVLMMYPGQYDGKGSFVLDFNVFARQNRSLLFSFRVHRTNINSLYQYYNYRFGKVDAKFDLERLLKKYAMQLDDVSIEFYVQNINTKSRASEPFELKIRSIKRATNSNSRYKTLLCSKCMFLKKNEYKQTRWWLEMLKQSGYTQIHVCNHSIPNTDEYNNLFEEFNDFLRFSHFRCIPNFLNFTPEYFTSITELKHDGHYCTYMAEGLHVLNYNHCYLENIEEFDYVTVYDNDEIILPQISEHVSYLTDSLELVKSFKFEKSAQSPSNYLAKDKCNQFSTDPNPKESSDTSSISGYLKYLNWNYYFNPEKSFYFSSGDFFKRPLIEKILLDLEMYLKTVGAPSASFDNTEHRVIVVDPIPKSESYEPYNQTITISSQEEYLYAINLIRLYKKYIKPFFDANNATINGSSNGYFDRVFLYMPDWYKWGKSFHHTRHSFEFNEHHQLKHFIHSEGGENGRSSEIKASVFDSFTYQEPEAMYVDEEMGYLSHFRIFIKFSPKEMRVSQIYFDFNYFNCFFLPILQKTSKHKINLAPLDT